MRELQEIRKLQMNGRQLEGGKETEEGMWSENCTGTAKQTCTAPLLFPKVVGVYSFGFGGVRSAAITTQRGLQLFSVAVPGSSLPF
jgi:hypothetical protein